MIPWVDGQLVLGERRLRQELEQRGVRNAIETEGYGKQYLLYDDHGDPASLEAQRNRRVEIYIERDREAQRQVRVPGERLLEAPLVEPLHSTGALWYGLAW